MRTFSTVILPLLVASALFAQGDRGTLTGSVTDTTGAVVANARIEARQVNTGAVTSTTSTDTGNYTLDELPYGPYEIMVTMPGFKKLVRSGITVQVAQTIRADLQLEVGEVTESITVSAEASLLKTESGDVSHNVDVNTLDSLPMLGTGVTAGAEGIRNPQSVTMVIPGAYFVPNVSVKINGAPQNTMAVHIEGMDSTVVGSPFTPAQMQPSVDAIQDISVQTSNYAAEYGAVGGGLYNVTIRSGTNQLHGSAYDYMVNEVLNAGEPFPLVNIPVHPGQLLRPRARRHDYGFTIGGPVRIPHLYNGKDRTFFFFNWEQFRETKYVNYTDTVPTDAYRDGNFSSAIIAGGNTRLTAPGGVTTDANGVPLIANTIYDPKSAATINGQANVLTPFPNNTIPLTRLDPVALAVQNLIPLPTNTASFNNYQVTNPSVTHTKIPAVKIDQIINSKQKISTYWSDTYISDPRDEYYGNYEGLPSPITEERGSFIGGWEIRTNYDYSITPTLLLHLGAGFWDDKFFDDAPVLNYNAQQQLGLAGATLDRNFPVFNGFCAASTSCGAAGGTYAMGPPSQSHQFWEKPATNGAVTWVKGSHTIKAGYDVYWTALPQFRYTYTNGAYTFSANETGQSYLVGTALSGGSLGFPYASFLLGEVDTYNVAALADFRPANYQMGLFVQDSWKFSRKLTFTYGARYDYATYFREEHGREVTFSPATPNPSAGGELGAFIFEGSGPGHCNCSFAHNYPYALQPRLGVAYTFLPKTVLRAGFGLVYAQTGTTQTGITQGGIIPTVTRSSQGLGIPAATLAQGLPATPAWPVVSPGVAPYYAVGNQALPSGVGWLDPNAGRAPRQTQWSVGVEREILPNLALDVTYVGSTGVWWPAPSLEDLNALTPSILAAHGFNLSNAADVQTLFGGNGQAALLSQTLAQANPAALAAHNIGVPYTGFSTSQTVAQALRPYPQFANIPAQGDPLGKTWYNSLQAKMTKRFSHGLAVTSTFAWQKSEDVGIDGNSGSTVPNGGQAATNYVNAVSENPFASKTISGLDQPLILTIFGSYQLPNIHQLGKYPSWVMKDWTVGTLLSYSSGLPIPVPAATTSLSAQLFQGNLMNRVPGQPLYLVSSLNCHCFDPSTTPVLNPAAWANPAPGQFSTSSPFYSDFRYERHPNENINLGRTWLVKERATISLRVEFANFLNRTYINNPTATNPTIPVTRNAQGLLTGGFGYINTAFAATNAFATPRNGTIVMRVSF